MKSLVQIAIGGRGGRHARAAVRAVGALDGVCVLEVVLGAGAAVVAKGVGAVTRPLARPPKGTQKKSLDAAVA